MTPTNRPRCRRAASLVAAVALGLAACGGDDAGDDEPPAVTAAEPEATSPAGGTAAEGTDEAADDATDGSDSAAGDSAAGDSAAGDADEAGPADAGDADEADYQAAAERALQVPDEELNECLSAAYVDWLDVDRLRAAGVTPDVLAGSLSAADLGITSDEASVEPLSEAIDDCGDVVQRLFDDADLTDIQRECTERFLTEELGAQLLAHQLAGLPQSDELSAVQDDVQACAADE